MSGENHYEVPVTINTRRYTTSFPQKYDQQQQEQQQQQQRQQQQQPEYKEQNYEEYSPKVFKKVSQHSELLFKGGCIVSLVVIIGMLSQMFVNLSKISNTANTDKPKERTSTSCRTLNTYTDGFYQVFDKLNDEFIEVFCDMTTNGGGWTLVASIHEDDISKCDFRDRWSTKNLEEPNAWESYEDFEWVGRSLKTDYKNSIYFSKQDFTDVMIWHVDKNKKMENSDVTPRLIYYTKSKFLERYGGNLQQLYSKWFPLKRNATDSGSVLKQLNNLLNAIMSRNGDIRSSIPGIYNYTGEKYDYYYRDRNVFNAHGNYIYYLSKLTPKYGPLAKYDQIVSLGNDSFMSTRSGFPFHALMMITNDENYNKDDNFGFRVYHYFRCCFTNTTELTGSLERGEYSLEYRAGLYNLWNGYTVCNLYYTVYNGKKWLSKKPTNYQDYKLSNSHSNNYDYMTTGGMNYLVGFMLLARNNSLVTRTEIENILNIVLDAVVASGNLFEFEVSPGLFVPVEFAKGSINDIMSDYPTDYQHFYEPGYIQFRAYNYNGFPNALCPGVRSLKGRASLFCVGALTNSTNTCSDFAGIGGYDKQANLTNQDSLKNITSTILVFYR